MLHLNHDGCGFSLVLKIKIFLFTAYSFEGILVFSLLVICTCAYMRRVPRLKQWFLSEKKGFLGVFYKGRVTIEYSTCTMFMIAIKREYVIVWHEMGQNTEVWIIIYVDALTIIQQTKPIFYSYMYLPSMIGPTTDDSEPFMLFLSMGSNDLRKPFWCCL